MEQKIEVLAPAGSYEGFEAAIGAGADAVYVGGAAFGARAYAKNFGQEELLRAIEAAHLHHRKLYLTVNTLLKNRELEEQLYDYLSPYYEAGLDGVIVQDFGVFSFIREHFGGLPIHASTQMTVTGTEGMAFLEEQGASRVVAARELSLEELSRMRAKSAIEIEAFVHGALCYSFSGQCLMSSLFGGRSGNRGRCAQPCRLPYQVSLSDKKWKGNKELCPLSLKDICTLDILPQIIKAGVTSLKIEGRMKQPSYTAGVTGMYRKYVDRLLEYGYENYQVDEQDRRAVLDLFSRGGSCSGYYEMQNGPSMMSFTNEKKTVQNTVAFGACKKKVRGRLMLYPGCPALLEVFQGEISVTVTGAEVEFAKNQPMEEGRVRAQMEKLGNTEFLWEDLEIQMDDHIFVSVKTLNDLRREGLEAFRKQVSSAYKRLPGKPPLKAPPSKNKPAGEALPIYVSCETLETAEIFVKEPEVKGLYLSFDIMEKLLTAGVSQGKEMYLSLPHVTRGVMPDKVREKISLFMEKGMKGFLVRNLESFAMLREMGYGHLCVLDHSLYTWNNRSVGFWEKQGILRNTAPLELNEKELGHRDNRRSEMVVYGYLPLMESAQCLRKNLFGCSRKEETLYLKDRYGKEFPVICYCHPWKDQNTENGKDCYNIVYNSIPFGLVREHAAVKRLGPEAVRLSFTFESPKEAKEIYTELKGAYREGMIVSPRELTKGHFKRGAE